MPKPIFVHTYTGKTLDLNNLKPSDIDIEDIAQSLSNTSRFMGHSKAYFCNAQHCVNVSLVCEDGDELEGLMHDASEAYVGDVTSPLKHSGEMDWYVRLEKEKVAPVVARAFNLRYDRKVNERVKLCDNRMLATEVGQLLTKPFETSHEPYKKFKIRCLPPLKAKQLFLNRFYELKGRR